MDLQEIIQTIEALRYFLAEQNNKISDDDSKRLISRNQVLFTQTIEARLDPFSHRFSRKVFPGILLTSNGFFLTTYQSIHNLIENNRGGNTFEYDEKIFFITDRDNISYPVQVKTAIFDQDHNLAIMRAETGGPPSPVPFKLYKSQIYEQDKIDFECVKGEETVEIKVHESKNLRINGSVTFFDNIFVNGHIDEGRNLGGALMVNGKLAGILSPPTSIRMDNYDFPSQFGTKSKYFVMTIGCMINRLEESIKNVYKTHYSN